MTKPSGLDSPDYATFAWARFRRILSWMGLATALVIAIAIVGLKHFYGPLGWIAILAAIGGVGGSVMLAAALMGLAFLSSGSGHDESVDDID
ncbi:hypothetical protein ACVWZA_000865 [Sphingomonas sp. UYAg733]